MGLVRRTYPWAVILDTSRERPGKWWRHTSLIDAPARTVGRIRGRNHPDLRVDDGVLEARITNEYQDELGTKRGDIWVRFVPHRGVVLPPEGATKRGPR